MKKLLLIPTIIYPYSFVLGFILSQYLSKWYDDTYMFLGFVLLFMILPLACNIIYMVLSRNEDPHKLIRTALVIKLVHVPSYVIVFISGVFASLMIFMTLPLVIMFIVFDCIVFLSSSFISVYALAKNIRENKVPYIIALICQFFYCADAISLLVIAALLKDDDQTILQDRNTAAS